MLDDTIPKFDCKESDLNINWFSGTGSGGQHRNKHMNSCRITHIPTGLVTTSQCRSRQNSYQEALDEMKKRLYDKHIGKHTTELSRDRKEKVGSGMRGDKVKTYRFQDDIVSDHQTGKKSSCSLVMRGNIDLLW